MIINLSYPLTLTSPLYPGTPKNSVTLVKSIDAGDSANTSSITINSHSGTHIDLPRHFCSDGDTVCDHIPPEWILEKTYCLEILKGCDDCLMPEDLLPFIEETRDATALIINTGFHKQREADPVLYASEHPWVHPDVPGFLRQEWPDLRLFGIDTISVSTPKHRGEGRSCHRAFLCGEFPIIIMEDVNLSGLRHFEGCWRMLIYPVVYDQLDGTPVLVFAERMSELVL